MSVSPMLRAVNSVTGLVMPEIAAQAAKRVLLHPRRHEAGPREQAALASARRVTFRFGLSGLGWGRPDDPVVLMLHGWEGRSTQFASFVAPLVGAGRQLIALDAPGHGESRGEQATLMEFAMALLEAAVEIPALESVVGHSMGAAATAIALAQGLNADRAVLIGSPSSIEDSLLGFANAFGLPPRATRRFVELVGLANGIAAGELDISRSARALRIPALIVHDRDDQAVPYADGDAIARNWRGAQLLTTTGVGHWRVLHDARVVKQVCGFLTRGTVRMVA